MLPQKQSIDHKKNQQKNPLNYKIAKCKNWEKDGTCKYGMHCTFAHGDSELRNKANNLYQMQPMQPNMQMMYNPMMMGMDPMAMNMNMMGQIDMSQMGIMMPGNPMNIPNISQNIPNISNNQGTNQNVPEGGNSNN